MVFCLLSLAPVLPFVLYAVMKNSGKRNIELTYFLAAVGEPYVGKSHLLNRYVNGNSHHTETSREGNVLVVYDITQRRSFEKAKELVDEFAQRAGPGAFVALVGNKVDLESRREVSFREAQDYADGNNIVEIFMEVSALTGENVEDLFSKVVKRLTEAVPGVELKLALRRKTWNLSERNLNSDEIEFLITIFMSKTLSPAYIQSLNLSYSNLGKLPRFFLFPLETLTCLEVNDNRLSFLPAVSAV